MKLNSLAIVSLTLSFALLPNVLLSQESIAVAAPIAAEKNNQPLVENSSAEADAPAADEAPKVAVVFTGDLVNENQKDFLGDMQRDAAAALVTDWGYWGSRSTSYSGWTNHSNRLIPVYTFNCDFQDYVGKNSVYRNEDRLREIYHRTPTDTLNPNAEYGDQTDIYRLQQHLIEKEGKRRVILIVFDGTDWQTTWAAATYKSGKVAYDQGRGSGLSFQDYDKVKTDFAFVVTSPHDLGEEVDVNAQVRLPSGEIQYGGYCATLGGETPWAKPADFSYLMNRSRACPHAVTDSSSSATSLMAGIKTYNGAVNMDRNARPVPTLAHWLQRDKQWSVGAVSSVPISHATPASAYAQNVSRDDYQDLTRDLIGLPSIVNKQAALSGLDVLIGCGWGVTSETDSGQGANFVPGNRYLTQQDFETVTSREQNAYVAALRTPGESGARLLRKAAQKAIRENSRLLGYFGTSYGHLPFRTANGDFEPMPDMKDAEKYTHADIFENPDLADMAVAALDVLSQNENGFWVMIEAGDVDWANHANNIDNSIGAMLSGERMVNQVFEWIENNGGWDDTAVIVTADHGHYLNITRPEALTRLNQVSQ